MKYVRYSTFPYSLLLLLICGDNKKGLRLDEIKTHKWTILPCSAMTGKNLQEGLDWVVKDAQERLFLY